MQRRLFRITHNNCWTHWHWWGALIQQQWITLRNYNMRESSESVYLAEQSYHIFDGVWQKLWRLHFFTHTQKKKKKKKCGNHFIFWQIFLLFISQKLLVVVVHWDRFEKNTFNQFHFLVSYCCAILYSFFTFCLPCFHPHCVLKRYFLLKNLVCQQICILSHCYSLNIP